MVYPLLLLGCAPQSSRCIHPHSHWVLALRVSPTSYHLYHLIPHSNTLSLRVVSKDELTQTLHANSGCIVGSVPASKASTFERVLQSLSLPTPPSTPPSTPTLSSTTPRDEGCLCHFRWLEALRSLRLTTYNDRDIRILIRDEEETCREMERRSVEWSSRTTDSASFIDWLVSGTL